jgi:hypothetical protein
MRIYALLIASFACVLPCLAFFGKGNGLQSPLPKNTAGLNGTQRNARFLSRLKASIVSSGLSKASGLSPCSIKVVGVGGAGGNAVSRMREASVKGVEFWAINTDAQILAKMPNGTNVVQIGEKVARGLGAGGVPEVTRRFEKGVAIFWTALTGIAGWYGVSRLGGKPRRRAGLKSRKLWREPISSL